MRTFVLDTSVVLKWYNRENEEHVEESLSVLNDLREEKIAVVVPNLLIIELLNVFIKGKNIGSQEASNLISSFFELPIVNKEPTPAVVSRIPGLCKKHNLTSYDSLYLATAIEEDCKLISDDIRGHGKIFDGTVLLLKDYKSM